MSIDLDAVADLLREVAAQAVMPVYRRREADPRELTPGEWVTSADLAAEAMLTPALLALAPGSVVVAEEAAKADPSLLAALQGRGDVWLVDPLDGTSNFAQGREPLRLMVAHVRDGVTTAAWVLDPVTGSLACAERGAGAWLDGERLTAPASDPAQPLRGAALRRFLPSAVADQVTRAEQSFSSLGVGSGCAGADYVDVALGRLDAVLYWRTLAWDHLPGALILQEAGGVVRRPDGSGFDAATSAAPGLLAASDEDAWRRARSLLVPAPVVVSSCLAGVPCRYDGNARPDPQVVDLVARGAAVPLCAEVLGGLPTPRPAAEIVGGDGDDVLAGRARILTEDGDDLTDAFVAGARAAADRAVAAGASRAVLQARSPSCGCSDIYDGTHTGSLRPGRGVVAAELERRGIAVEDRRGERRPSEG